VIDKNDETAFPVPIGQTGDDRCGMSLRDWFAGKAMEAKLISGDWGNYDESASDCYDIADAMMEARKAKDNAEAKNDSEDWKVKRIEFLRIVDWASSNGLDNMRACKSLARGGLDALDKIKPEALSEIKNCGVKTVEIIMDWKARKEAKQ